MNRVAVCVLLLGVGMSLSAYALTGSGDSGGGPLDTVPPRLDSVTATSVSSLEVYFSKPMLAPGATTPGNYSISGTGAGSLHPHPASVDGDGPYVLGWTSGEMLASGIALTAAGVQDAAGNLVDPAGNTVQGMGVGAKVSLYAPPSALAMLAAGLLVLVRRRHRICAVPLLVLTALIAAPTSSAQAPTVSNVAFVQSPNGTIGTKVDITYDLVAPGNPCHITVSLSEDGGSDGFIHPVTSITGDVAGVTTGTGKHIVWDITADYPRQVFANARIRVTADDTPFSPAPEMVSVPSGTFMVGNSGVGEDALEDEPNEVPQHQVTLEAYQIGKYHVTNRQYCDILNWAFAQGFLKTTTGAVWAGTGDIYAGDNLQIILAYSHSDSNILYSGGVFSSKTKTGLPGTTTYSMDSHPVENVTWYGAVAFCNWLSQMQGMTPCYDMTTADWPLMVAPPTPGGYRLPTEAEWERAAAWDGTKHWIYGFTGDTMAGRGHANYYIEEDEPSGDVNPGNVNPLGLTSKPYTSPVGWFNGVNVSPNGSVHTLNGASPVGAYDMSGNVNDWCGDWYAGYGSGAQTNPTGPAFNPGLGRVARGGSWNASGLDYCRSASRYNYGPAYADDGIGLRLARS